MEGKMGSCPWKPARARHFVWPFNAMVWKVKGNLNGTALATHQGPIQDGFYSHTARIDVEGKASAIKATSSLWSLTFERLDWPGIH